MKKIQVLLIGSLLTISSVSFAEVLEVYNWKAIPGKAQQMLSTMNEAAEIHTALGATVGIYQLNVGSENQVDYVVRTDDQISWGKFKDKLAMIKSSIVSSDTLQLIGFSKLSELLESLQLLDLSVTRVPILFLSII